MHNVKKNLQTEPQPQKQQSTRGDNKKQLKKEKK